MQITPHSHLQPGAIRFPFDSVGFYGAPHNYLILLAPAFASKSFLEKHSITRATVASPQTAALLS
jgi:hypothetical protein